MLRSWRYPHAVVTVGVKVYHATWRYYDECSARWLETARLTPGVDWSDGKRRRRQTPTAFRRNLWRPITWRPDTERLNLRWGA